MECSQVQKFAKGLLSSEHIIHFRRGRFSFAHCFALVCSLKILYRFIRVLPMKVLDLTELFVELIEGIACRYCLDLFRP